MVRTLRLLLIELRQEEEALEPDHRCMPCKPQYKPQATYAHTAWELGGHKALLYIIISERHSVLIFIWDFSKIPCGWMT